MQVQRLELQQELRQQELQLQLQQEQLQEPLRRQQQGRKLRQQQELRQERLLVQVQQLAQVPVLELAFRHKRSRRGLTERQRERRVSFTFP